VIKGFHWLTHEGGKFSTSRGRGVFCDDALDALPADLWRWWLIANAPETSDADFQPARFVADVNKDLADVFGNLLQRVLAFAHRSFDGRVPAGGAATALDAAAASDISGHVAALRRHHEAREFRRAAAETRALWSRANAYVQDAAPWSALRSDRSRAEAATRTALNIARICALVAWSIVPDLAETALRKLGEPADRTPPPWPDEVERLVLGTETVGRPLGGGEVLVRRIGLEQLAFAD
jgi:methionyl-tRNA synthetase